MDDLGQELATRLAPWISHGVSYTSAWEVYNEFSEMIDALDILGRPDLSQALGSRVSLDLCTEHAAVLKVLQLCSQNVTQAKAPVVFLAQPDVSDDAILREINIDTPDFSMYKGGDTSDSEHENNPRSEGEFEDNAKTTESEVVKPKSYEIDAVDKACSLVREISRQHKIASEIASPPGGLSYSRMVGELALLVLRLPCFQKTDLIGVSPECSQSLWEQFDKIPFPVELGAQSSDLLSCTTIIELLAKVESQILAPQPNRELAQHRQVVASWLTGEIYDWPFLLPDFQRFCPPEWYTTNLYDACLYALLSRKVYHKPPPPPVLPVKNQLRWLNQQYMLRNGDHLMSCGLRVDLQAAWQQLSAVYLAQDERVLLILNHWTNESPSSDLAELNSYLRSIWPTAPFSLVGEPPMPTLQLSIHPWLVDVFGPNFSRLFYPEALKRAWMRSVNAFRCGDQSVEFDLRDITLRVRDFICVGLTVEPYFTDISE